MCKIAYKRWLRRNTGKKTNTLDIVNVPEPPHAITVIADRYYGDSQQQLQQQIVFSDGLGRLLQASRRVEQGLAYSRSEDGTLVLDGSDVPVQVQAAERWAVTGRTEYDNKGQVIRKYQPYYLDDWRYISDDSARENAYADTHVYDPTGREIKVITAKGFERRVQYFPWFAVNEDENDTAASLDASEQ